MAQIKSYTDEIWKDITGLEGLYQISSHGRVKSFHKKEPRLLSNCVGVHGYCVVLLHDGNGYRKNAIDACISLGGLRVLPATEEYYEEVLKRFNERKH